MPTIVDASIRGKLTFPIVPNVVSSNEGHHPGKQAAGMSRVTFQNAQRIEAGKGNPHPDPTNSNLKETMGIVRLKGGSVTQGLTEQSKGLYVSTTG